MRQHAARALAERPRAARRERPRRLDAAAPALAEAPVVAPRLRDVAALVGPA